MPIRSEHFPYMSKFGESILRACASAATRGPWLVLAVTLVLTVLAGYSATRLTVNTSTSDILSAELPFRQVEIKYREAFPKEELAVVVIDAPDSGEADATARGLMQHLATRASLFERTEIAGASPYFDHYGLLFLSTDQLTALGQGLRPARRLLMTLAADPSLRGLAKLMSMAQEGVSQGAAPGSLAKLLSQLADTLDKRAKGQPAEMQWTTLLNFGPSLQGARRLVQVLPILNDRSINRAGPALDGLKAAIAETAAEHPGATLRLTGEPVLRQQELNDALAGAIRASILSFFLVSATLIIGIGSGRLIAALLITLIVGTIWTTGLAALAVGRLNLISVTFMVLFFGLGIDFGTHLGLRHLEEVRSGKNFKDALYAAMMGEGPSITLSAVCAALAFLSFVPTYYTGLAEFGIISALGMMVALVISFTVQPALMALMPPKVPKRRGMGIGIGNIVPRHFRAVLVIAALISLGAAIVAPKAWLDTNILNLQDQSSEPVKTYRDLAADPETSPYALDVLAPDLDAAAEMAKKLAAVDGVAGVRWIGDFVPRDQEAKLAALAAVRERAGDGFFQTIDPAPPPSDEELTQAFAALQESAKQIASPPADIPVDEAIPPAGARLAASLQAFAQAKGTDPDTLRTLGVALTDEVPGLTEGLKQKLSVTTPVTIDDIPADLRSDWISSLTGEVRLRVMPAGDIDSAEGMKRFTEAVQAVASGASGVPASVTGAGHEIFVAFVQAISYTAIAIGLVVIILRRRLSDVLLVLAPLAVAALWTVAGSALIGLPFNFANIIVIPLLIGLGVASSIHMVTRGREISEERAAGKADAKLLGTSTPRAVLITQVNTVAAFATLAIAKHQGLFSMGVLLGMAILLVLIVSLIVLPAFMIAIGISAKPEPKEG